MIQDYLAWNEEQAARKRDWSLEAVLEDLGSAREGLVAAADELSAEQWE